MTERQINILRVLLALIAGAGFLLLIRPMIAPVLLAAIFAVILQPLNRRMLSKNLHPLFTASTCTFLFVVIFLIPVSGMILGGINTGLSQFKKFESSLEEGGGQSLQELVEKSPIGPAVDRIRQLYPGEEEDLVSFANSMISGVGSILADVSKIVLGGVPAILVSVFVVAFSLFYFLLDGERLVSWAIEHSLFSKNNTEKVFEMTGKACRSAILSSFVTGLIQAALMGLGCLITGVSNVLLIVTATFFFSFVPLVGTAPLSILIMLVLYFQGSTSDVLIFLVVALVIGVSDNFIRPLLVKKGAPIHPLAAFIFTFGAIGTIGFYGLFLGPVAAGIFLSLMQVATRSSARVQTA